MLICPPGETASTGVKLLQISAGKYFREMERGGFIFCTNKTEK
jgi:hypothetical protein